MKSVCKNNSSAVRVRIAPSPTGNLHLGTARTAVFNWLYTRHLDGKFIVRIEDTDLHRSHPKYTKNILDGLTWLGLNWDNGPFFQTDRYDLYKKAIQNLLDKGLAYRCYCTQDDLRRMRDDRVTNKLAPRYDNRCRDLTDDQKAVFKGQTSVIRFKIDDDLIISWDDMVRGKITWKGSDLGGDMVIARSSSTGDIGDPLYNLSVVVDDINMQITHVIRGDDHIANTAKQILLYKAFGADLPKFAHTPLILDDRGQKLSKRNGVTSISDFQKLGYLPGALVNYITLLGWSPSDPTKQFFTLDDAAKVFDFDRVSKAGARFDWAKLNWMNSQYLHNMPVYQLTDLLIPFWKDAGYKFDITSDRDWLDSITALIRPSLVRLPVSDRDWLDKMLTYTPGISLVPDAVDMVRYFFVPDVNFTVPGKAQLLDKTTTVSIAAVLDMLDNYPNLTADDARDIIDRVSKLTGLKRGVVMRSLRVALTGDVHGFDLIDTWIILNHKGLDKKRLSNVLTAI